jgi:hypothetical protein
MKLILEIDLETYTANDCFLIDIHWCKITNNICLGDIHKRPADCPFKEVTK